MKESNVLLAQQKFTSSDRVILFGSGGTGKSAAMATLFLNAPEDRRVIYLMTDRNSAAGLEWGLKHYKIELEEQQLIYVFPQRKDKAFSNMRRAVKEFQKESKVNALQGKKESPQNKDKYLFFDSILDKLDNFVGTDFATGKEISVGSVADLDSSDILIIDGLSPITHEIWNVSIGDKVAIAQSDYGTPQRLLQGLFLDIQTLECNVILLAHEREHMNNNTGVLDELRVDIGVGVAGYSKLMGCFSEVIHAYKQGTLYKWEAEKNKVGCIARKMPKESNLEPNFSKYNLFK
jgi:hypothetical protein